MIEALNSAHKETLDVSKFDTVPRLRATISFDVLQTAARTAIQQISGNARQIPNWQSRSVEPRFVDMSVDLQP